jgi:hypothetical protein
MATHSRSFGNQPMATIETSKLVIIFLAKGRRTAGPKNGEMIYDKQKLFQNRKTPINQYKF